MKKEEVDKIGKGRVWTGSQAKEIGLADEIGGLSRAIQMAKHLAGIPEEEEVKLVIWPKKISLFRALFGRKTVQANFPVDHRLQNILRTLQALEKERIWAVMPFWIHPE
jgi:protease-4